MVTTPCLTFCSEVGSVYSEHSCCYVSVLVRYYQIHQLIYVHVTGIVYCHCITV